MSTRLAMKHVLLIEPDAILSRQIRSFLQDDAVTVAAAATAQEAISQADAKRPDAVVLELVLPSHNGVEFLHEFRSYAEWSDIPVIVFSLQHLEDASALTSMGNVTYLYKPQSRLSELRQQLKDLLA